MNITSLSVYNWFVRYKYHFYFWPPVIGFFVLLDYIQYYEYSHYQRHLYMAFVQLCIFYSSLFAIKKFETATAKSWIKSIGRFLLSFGFIMFLNHWRGKIAARFDLDLHPKFYLLFLDTIRIYWGLAFYAIGYYYLTRSNQKEKQLRAVEQEKATAELATAHLALQNAELVAQNALAKQQLLEMENKFLRAQINPHFLYNTLNMFYTQTRPLSTPLANNILTLSRIMRYSLETTHHGQLAPLKMEVEHLKRVISIHQLRFNNQLQLSFTIEGPYAQVLVAPLIFITLLENALKHGVTNDPARPIVLWLAVDNSHIYFTIRNKKSNRPRGQSHGIGLDNIKSRLQNVYGSRCHFAIEQAADEFHVVLAIEHRIAIVPTQH